MEPYMMNTFRDFTEIGLAVTVAGLGLAAGITGTVMFYQMFRDRFYRDRDNNHSTNKPIPY